MGLAEQGENRRPMAFADAAADGARARGIRNRCPGTGRSICLRHSFGVDR